MSEIINLTTDANQKQEVVVDGQPVSVTMRFSDIPEVWYFSLFDLTNNVSIIDNVRATTNALLIINKAIEFRGNFSVVANSNAIKNEDVTRDNLGVTHFLIYLAEDEL